tara:strand:+ start:294 stop:1685 length:1392 start_codon:yes stop_codon:yes gene_type:complete
MIFSSITFLFFFIIYFFANLFLPLKYRNYLIIIGSTVFYAWWKVDEVWVPFFISFIGLFGGRIISNESGFKKKYFLWITLLFIFSPLLIFKYQSFFYNDFFVPLFGLKEKVFNDSIPLGISFISFTVTSYVVDVFRKKFSPETSIKSFLAYIMFFPQLIAGPVLRPNELIPQLEKPNPIILKKSFYPFFLFTIGLVKKVVFADYFASIVEPVFSNNLTNLNSLEIILGIYSFAIQIYCDFSGYTDMAISLSLLLGINLPINFSRPYFSKSIIDFWRKWHITLSDFLKDYLYIPLGGNKYGTLIQSRNILLTMLIGGLWHGANWTFVLWGLFHGIALIFVRIFDQITFGKVKLQNWFSTFLTFNFVTLTWIFFRSKTISQAFSIIRQPFLTKLPNINEFIYEYNFAICLIILFFILHKWDDVETINKIANNFKLEILLPLTMLLWILVVSFSSTSSAAFIYFDF